MPTTRDRILDALEEVLVGSGPGSVTLEAVAASAGVSKGGLLYHFRSKDALVEGLLERLRARAAEDVERMRSDPAGALAYYVRTSADVAEDGPLHRTMVAAILLAQTSAGTGRQALEDLGRAWFDALREEVGDPDLARLVQLVGDGLWLASSTGADPGDVDGLLRLLQRLARESAQA